MRDNGSTSSASTTQTRARSVGTGAFAAVAAVSAVAVVVGLGIATDHVAPVGQNWWLVAWLVVGTADAVVGAALVTRYGHRRLAGCLMTVGVAGLLVAVATQAGGYAAEVAGGTGWSAVTGARAWAHPIATGVLAALVPWELVTTRRRSAIEVVWWTTAALIAVIAVAAATGANRSGFDVVDVATWLVAASATAATVRLVGNWWHGRTVSDDPLPGWLATGSFVAWLAVVPDALVPGWRYPGGDVAGALLLLASVPVLVVGAIVSALRERPGRFHGVAHDVIGWLVLSGAIVVLYTGTVAGLGGLVGGEGPTWMLVASTGIIAVSVDPARRRIRWTVDRLVWGARDDPLEVVRSVVDRVGANSGDDLLPALVASLQRDLRLDAVAIDVRTSTGWRRDAAVGPPTPYERIVELEQHEEVVGRLIVGWEYGPSLRATDDRVLNELAGPLGLAVGWVRLADELRRSSVAILSTREEERRRIRRDLHDGLGPALTGVSLGLRTALRQMERTDSDTFVVSRRLLERTADEVDSLVVEVKRIVRDLRPTALDQLGLVDAVIAFTRTFDDELDIQLSMPGVPVQLPAAVEVATYRIVAEAVTNVVRHAHADRCWLTISAGSTIDIDVIDDGIGVDAGAPVGVGWTAMRERAAELGGSVQVAPHFPHGTRVHVRLPVAIP
jgi:signal transduction histidine kinase